MFDSREIETREAARDLGGSALSETVKAVVSTAQRIVRKNLRNEEQRIVISLLLLLREGGLTWGGYCELDQLGRRER